MRKFTLAILLAGTGLVSAAQAQSNLEPRVDRLEREMRAVQRTVFPNGAGRTVSPDIAPADPVVGQPGIPATSPVADLDARVATLERQQQTLTGQIEQNQYRLRQIEEAFANYKRTTDARLSALEQGAATPAEPDTGPAPITRPAPGATARPAVTPPAARPSTPAPRPVATTGGAATTGTAATPVRADPARAERVAAVERPAASGDAAEDAYLYGYRLWEAKLYPEAQAQLKDVVAKYPRHRRASYAQNLLGRAYLDEGRPSLASVTFYDSFKKFPEGERAPDSLYFLGQSLMKLNKPADACKVYAELDASYGTKIGPDLKAKAAQGRADAKCK